MYQCSALSSLPSIRHGFFGRQGGVSDGLYASLNTGYGSGDDPEKVKQNRARVVETLGVDAPLLTCFQIHSANVVTVNRAWEWKDSPEADALVTNQPGIALGILTADCLPVLFADTKKQIIGAAHAGWKGAFSGVLEATMDAMKALGAEEIIATIGPAIAQNSYEVGPEFHQQFIQQSPQNAAYFLPSSKEGHYLFNLAEYARMRLVGAGIAQTHVLAYDTCSLEDEFFSFRRATHRKENMYGRQVAAIALR